MNTATSGTAMRATEPNESLRGTINRIIFSNKESGFAIALLGVATNGTFQTITLSGNLPYVAIDDEITVEGKWDNHPKYGRQFKCSSYMKVLPTKAEAIEAYLGSGMIKGLGASTAAKIVKVFGDKTLDVLSKNPSSLMSIPGIGKKKCETISRAWKEQMAVTDIMVFLAGCGITASYAAKIYRKYGLNAIAVIQENPYQLSYDITGIGFIVADRIARKIGFRVDDPRRIQAGTLYALEECRKQGHVYYPDNILKSRAAELLEVGRDLVEVAMVNLLNEKRIVIEGSNGQCNVYTPSLFMHEKGVARDIHRLKHAKSFFGARMGDIENQVKQAEKKFDVQLSPEQVDAVLKAGKNTVSVLTGGPGCGKTTVSKIIVEIFKQKDANILLAAPTGKAAKRLELCGEAASTIHRLLEFSPMQGGFQRNADNPLECDVLIVDEMSMADISLFHFLLCAVPSGAHLIIIGDADQLPPVGPGLSLRHLIDSAVVPVTVLSKIYRQAEGSGIVQLAHAINKGIVPDSSFYGEDCIMVNRENPTDAVARVVEIVMKLKAEGTEAQVLSPMRKGEAGTDRINDMLQDALNPIPYGQNETYQVVSGFRKFRINDRVIQTKNDYDRMVFNGDCGIVDSIDTEERQLKVVFEGRGLVCYDYLDLDELSLAYALSVHKSQGSEYQTVVALALTQHYVMLARNLIYTAVSRAKKQVILVGTTKALTIAVKNNKQKDRYSRLKDRLTSAFVPDFPGELG